jgi:hypothetical protein
MTKEARYRMHQLSSYTANAVPQGGTKLIPL